MRRRRARERRAGGCNPWVLRAANCVAATGRQVAASEMPQPAFRCGRSPVLVAGGAERDAGRA
eukprot:6001633-Lingulodinium_polyedra.AAC.1